MENFKYILKKENNVINTSRTSDHSDNCQRSIVFPPISLKFFLCILDKWSIFPLTKKEKFKHTEKWRSTSISSVYIQYLIYVAVIFENKLHETCRKHYISFSNTLPCSL